MFFFHDLLAVAANMRAPFALKTRKSYAPIAEGRASVEPDLAGEHTDGNEGQIFENSLFGPVTPSRPGQSVQDLLEEGLAWVHREEQDSQSPQHRFMRENICNAGGALAIAIGRLVGRTQTHELELTEVLRVRLTHPCGDPGVESKETQRYNLVAVCEGHHSPTNFDTGHYTARGLVDGTWYRFDDDRVTVMSGAPAASDSARIVFYVAEETLRTTST